MKKETIIVKGMHCHSCEVLIKDRLAELGVKTRVDLTEDKVDVLYNPEKIDLTKIKSEIRSLGYKVDGKKNKNSFWQGLMYGLIPHIGCIAFIIGSILGVTVLMNFFKPLLMSRYFFHALMGVSIGFATLSSALYLRKNHLFSWKGAKKKWGYLSTMYGSTIGINLLLFLVIFPMLANASSGEINTAGLSSLNLAVDIPCPGHAPLITEELKTIAGVKETKFSFPKNFEVWYDPSITNYQEILSLEVFKSYPATVLEGTVAESSENAPASCCGGSSCGSSTESCGCGSY
ncbi:MAG: heavy-metal-associated domain-containing protein [Candidatus Woesearchaeota archaeon]